LIDPIVGASPIELEIEPQLRRGLANRARGRPIVIDYYASRRCGLTVGDLTVAFATRPLERWYIELVPIDGVKVLAEERLVQLLSDGATLRKAALPLGDRLGISLAHPEHWIEFLDRCPGRRR
jgi:hypothetical protein